MRSVVAWAQPDKPWRLDSDVPLRDRLRRRTNLVRTALQAIACAIVVLAPWSGWSSLYFAGAFIFFLMMCGGLIAHAVAMSNFRSVPKLTPARADHAGSDDSVLIISPARNEAHEIERAARSLATQSYPNYDVVVVNDHSTDATGEILDRLAAEYPKLRVLHDPPPTPGFIGKPNAIRHALRIIQPKHEWLLFVDADVVLDSEVLLAAVSRANVNHADFLTCQPLLETGSAVEKLLWPSRWFSIISGTPYDDLNHPQTHPVGIGAFILIRREAYEASGGHDLHGLHHADDTLIAGVIKEAGGKVDLAHAYDLMRIRLYCGAKQSFQAVIAKIRTYSGDQILPSVAAVFGTILPSILPPLCALWAVILVIRTPGPNWPAVLYAVTGFCAYAAWARSFSTTALVSDVPKRWGWLHPLGSLVMLAGYVVATGKAVTGAPRYWRGREEVEGEGLL